MADIAAPQASRYIQHSAIVICVEKAPLGTGEHTGVFRESAVIGEGLPPVFKIYVSHFGFL
jgi:hypothetical protein